jgi:hypothetical protein
MCGSACFTRSQSSPKQVAVDFCALPLGSVAAESLTMRLSLGDDWPAAVVLVAAAMMIAPLWVVDTPAMPDYPAHLASFYLIAGGARDAVLSHYYRIEWAAIPNLAFEILVPLLSPLLSLGTAIKLLLSASVAMWTVGPALINRALHGRFGLTALGSVFFAYNDNFTWGFFNYYFAAGLTLLAFAGWISSATWSRATRLAALSLVLVPIYFSHVFSAALLLLLIGCYELGLLIEERKFSLRASFDALWPLAVATVPIAVLFLFFKPAGTDSPLAFNILDTLRDRYEAAIAEKFDQPGYVALAALIAFLLFGFWRGWVSVRKSMVPVLIALAVLVVAAPEEAMGGWGVDLRLPAVLGTVVFASVALKLPARGAAAIAGIVLLAVAWNAAALAGNWRYYDGQFREFRAALKSLPRGVRLMTVLDGDAIGQAADQPYWHIAEFAVMDRAGFTPLLFTTKGQHVVRLAPGMEKVAATSARQGSPPDATELDDLSAGTPDGDWDIVHVFPYLLHFPCKYDEAAIIHLNGKRSPVPDMLRLRHAGSFFSLYDIDRESCQAK